jgi:hypothetical protein
MKSRFRQAAPSTAKLAAVAAAKLPQPHCRCLHRRRAAAASTAAALLPPPPPQQPYLRTYQGTGYVFFSSMAAHDSLIFNSKNCRGWNRQKNPGRIRVIRDRYWFPDPYRQSFLSRFRNRYLRK